MPFLTNSYCVKLHITLRKLAKGVGRAKGGYKETNRFPINIFWFFFWQESFTVLATCKKDGAFSDARRYAPLSTFFSSERRGDFEQTVLRDIHNEQNSSYDRLFSLHFAFQNLILVRGYRKSGLFQSRKFYWAIICVAVCQIDLIVTIVSRLEQRFNCTSDWLPGGSDFPNIIKTTALSASSNMSVSNLSSVYQLA